MEEKRVIPGGFNFCKDCRKDYLCDRCNGKPKNKTGDK